MNVNYQLPEITLKFKAGNYTKHKISCSKTCATLLREMYDADTLEYTESFIVLLLNKQNETIGWNKISQGGLSSVLVDIRVLFTVALQAGATSMIISHNHPSGTLVASDQDLALTRRVAEAGKLLDIHLLDHIIITANDYSSLADKGLI